LGSGFFISPTGYIVTNNHVVEHAREVTVILKGGDQLEAEIVGTDEQTDLAVLKVKKSGKLPLCGSLRPPTNRASATGSSRSANPFGLGGTATAGIVSADGRPARWSLQRLHPGRRADQPRQLGAARPSTSLGGSDRP